MDPSLLATSEGAADFTCLYYVGRDDHLEINPDGLAGAWALYFQLPTDAQQALGGLRIDVQTAERADDARASELQRAIDALRAGRPVFLSVVHGDAPPPDELVAGRDVVYVGHTPAPAVLERVAALARSTTILDHHRAARELKADPRVCAVRVCVVHDPTRSSAQIAWDWATKRTPRPPREQLSAQAAGGRAPKPPPRPPVIDYIADGVLYAFKLQYSHAVYEAIHVEGVARSFAGLSAFTADATAFRKFAERGAVYFNFKAFHYGEFVGGAAQRATVRAHLPGKESPREYRVLLIKTPRRNHRVLSEHLTRGLEPDDVDFIIAWSLGPNMDEIWASAVTSRADIDLSEIAPNIVGATLGGGQPKVASFHVASDRIGDVATPL
jgi:hypothetical protein